MAFFPRACVSEAQTPFAPFFRLLEDLDLQSRSPIRQAVVPKAAIISPKFDVRETSDHYELHGEFPGLDQNNISLEFTDLNTLTVRAQNERLYETKVTTPTSVDFDNIPAVDAKASEASQTLAEDDETRSQKSLNATVEDEEEDGFVVTKDQASNSETPEKPLHEKSEDAVAPQAKVQTTEQHQPSVDQPRHRYHAYERSVGEFYRQFAFPRHIDQEAVTASMKNGILSVVVPKRRPETRRIVIQ